MKTIIKAFKEDPSLFFVTAITAIGIFGMTHFVHFLNYVLQ